MKKYYKIWIILFIAAGKTFLGMTSAKAEEKFAEKSLQAIIQNTNGSYQIENLSFFVKKQSYQSTLDSFKGKASNGVVISFKGEPLGFFSIAPDYEEFVCGRDEAKSESANTICSAPAEGEFLISVPYFPNGKYADVYDKSGKKVLTVDLSLKAACNENSRCDRPIEDSENCPQDCKSNEPKIEPALLQLAKDNAVAEANQNKNPFNVWILAAGIASLLLAGVLGYFFYQKNREN
jgi:hypothetical protein